MSKTHVSSLQKKYKLKKGQEPFTVMGGLLEGRTFKPGVLYDILYDMVPLQDKARFETVEDVSGKISGMQDYVAPSFKDEKKGGKKS